MTYDQVTVGRRVRVAVPTKKHCVIGTVAAKERLTVAGREIERVYIDTGTPRGRRLCSPSVLQEANENA